MPRDQLVVEIKEIRYERHVMLMGFSIVLMEVLNCIQMRKSSVYVDVRLHANNSWEVLFFTPEYIILQFWCKSPFMVLVTIFFRGARNLAISCRPSSPSSLSSQIKKKTRKPKKRISQHSSARTTSKAHKRRTPCGGHQATPPDPLERGGVRRLSDLIPPPQVVAPS